MLSVIARSGTVAVDQVNEPSPGPEDLLVKVRAAALNAADIMQMRGQYPAPAGVPQDILGLEIAGEVIAVGGRVRRWAVGDRVMALVGGGGQAEFATVNERLAMPIPHRLAWEQAGGFSEIFTTAYDALFSQAKLSLGDRLCVHGAAGGVGIAAIQLGLACGARVTATVRRSEHRPALAALGAEVISPDGLAASGPFDVILELVGAPNFPRNIEALNTNGRIMIIGVGGGSKIEIDLRQLMAKRAVILSSTLRSRTFEERASIARQVEAHVLPLVSDSSIRVPVFGTYPIQAAEAAYSDFVAGGKLGKLVITAG